MMPATAQALSRDQRSIFANDRPLGERPPTTAQFFWHKKTLPSSSALFDATLSGTKTRCSFGRYPAVSVLAFDL
jgi:hypothetical protein